MPPNELELFRELLSNFKQEIQNNLDKVTKQIENLTQKIDFFQKETNDINVKLGIFEERLNHQKVRIDQNFEQHSDFYARLGNLEKIPDETKRSEMNENEIIKIKTTAKTAYIIFGLIIAVLSLLFKLKIF